MKTAPAYSTFPPVEQALHNPNGLLASGGDLSVPRLLDAYRHGIFPWFNPGDPILWWSPDPRMVLFPEELHISRSLAKRLRHRDYQVRTDTDFGAVMQACAAPRLRENAAASGTWISSDMMAAYMRLHRQGYAHSVEVWKNGALVGGVYGVAIGRMFYGESMFSCMADASKIALVHLCRQLQRWGFGMIDCQMETAHLASMGARPISRSAFCTKLAVLIDLAGPASPWCFDASD